MDEGDLMIVVAPPEEPPFEYEGTVMPIDDRSNKQCAASSFLSASQNKCPKADTEAVDVPNNYELEIRSKTGDERIQEMESFQVPHEDLKIITDKLELDMDNNISIRTSNEPQGIVNNEQFFSTLEDTSSDGEERASSVSSVSPSIPTTDFSSDSNLSSDGEDPSESEGDDWNSRKLEVVPDNSPKITTSKPSHSGFQLYSSPNGACLESAVQIVQRALNDPCLKVPPITSCRNPRVSYLNCGEVIALNMIDDCGTIRVTNAASKGQIREVHFDFEDAYNISRSMVFLRKGSKVRFQINSSKSIRASIVIVNLQSNEVIRVPPNEENDNKDDDQPVTQKLEDPPECFFTDNVRRLNGTITKFSSKHGYGFIRGQKFSANVFVHVSQLYVKKRPTIPRNNVQVSFVLKVNLKDPYTFHAESVILDDEFASCPERSKNNAPFDNLVNKTPHDTERVLLDDKTKGTTQAKRELRWFSGQVMFVNREKKFAFIESHDMEENTHLSLWKLPEFDLPLQVRDQVVFQVDPKAKRQSASRVKVISYSTATRDLEDMDEFLDSSLKSLQSPKASILTKELANLDALWQYFECLNNFDESNIFWKAIRFLTQFFKNHSLKTDIGHILDILGQKSHFLEHVAQLPPENVSSNFLVVSGFCEQVITKCPGFVSRLFPIIKMLPTKCLEQLLWKFITKDGPTVGESVNWNSLTEGISDEEMMHDNLIRRDNNLSKVRIDVPYDCYFQYMDTYFRLLRAETFQGIHDGISRLRMGTLKHHEMNVFNGVRLRDVEVETLNLVLSIPLNTTNKRLHWPNESYLMRGNLICLLLKNQWKQFIWMTIQRKDSEIVCGEGHILAEMCSFNNKKKADILSLLYNNNNNKGDITMVESPTYFKSTYPALQALRALQMEKSTLCDSIVRAVPFSERPKYQLELLSRARDEVSKYWADDDDCLIGLSDEEEWNEAMQNLFESEDKKAELQKYLNDLTHDQLLTMDDPQKRAFQYALKNRLAIIQGPPGTGKTFIGTKIVETLLKFDLNSPILILTYKNHALDEFLKACLSFCDKKDLIRVGSGSKEPMLADCVLREQIGDVSIKWSFAISEVFSGMHSSTQQLQESLSQLWSNVTIDSESLAHSLAEDQLCALIRGASWSKGPDGIEFYSDEMAQCVDNTWVMNTMDDIISSFGSFSNCLQSATKVPDEGEVPQEDRSLQKHAKGLLDAAITKWLPSLEKLQQLRDLLMDSNASNWVENQSVGSQDYIYSCRDAESTHRNIKAKEYDEFFDYWKDLQNSGKVPWKVPAGVLSKFAYKEVIEIHWQETEMYDYWMEVESSRFKDPTFDHKKEYENAMWKLRNIMDQFETLLKVPVNNIASNHSFTEDDYPLGLGDQTNVLQTTRMWDLSHGQRYKFVYALIRSQMDDTVQETIDKLDELLKQRTELLNASKVEMMESKKIIGMTITGANMNSAILEQLKPKVVIVEEAAEVLEPQLFACLNQHVEHLILIGDHQQLRPKVESFPLVTDYQFDVSMMERLIRSNFPYQTLTNQSRMRPEFAELLSDIYLEYQTNLGNVSGNDSPEFMAKSMYFWTHRHMEDGRENGSKRNSAEADLVIALAKFLVKSGVPELKITILAPYMSQVELIRFKFKSNISIQTIDMFQGDENDVIIVSLVRSNKEGSIGFLNSLNRRCVLQSRAKCGFYVVGNEETLICGKGAKIWLPFVQAMKDRGCLGPKLPLQCRKHPSYLDVSQLGDLDLTTNPSKLCSKVCGDLFPCQLPEHACTKTCFPKHYHGFCEAKVTDTFSSCGHDVLRLCGEMMEDLNCQERISMQLHCGHSIIETCSKEKTSIICLESCLKEMECDDKHPCLRKCCQKHNHEAHSCLTKVDFSFPICKHPSPNKKKCGESIPETCMIEIKFTGNCNHLMLRKCGQAESTVTCESPCENKLRSCGHPCVNKCGDDCDAGSCIECADEVQRFRKRAKKRAKKLKTNLGQSKYKLSDLNKSDPQFLTVQDQVTKFVQAMHNWNPVITRVQLVQNPKLELAYEKAKAQGFGTYEDLKFHGTSEDGVQRIPEDGFREPGPPKYGKRPGMFGQGIYFATDSSKSAQAIYTKSSNKLLLCQVFLGKSLNLHKADHSMNKKKLNKLHCDSVFAPRGTAVRNDEFVIYNKSQAYVKYIVHFYTHSQPSANLVPPTVNGLTRKVLQPSRHFQNSNPHDVLFRIAESAYYRSGQDTRKKIQSVQYVVNPVLEMEFYVQKTNFKKAGIPDHEILAFHGTNPSNVDSILSHNLSLEHSKRFAHGKGLYFSEYPNVSLGYGDALILFKVLPGNEYQGVNEEWLNYQSKCVSKSGDGYGQMLIVNNSKQFHPFLLYKLV